MKKTLLLLATLALCVAAHAQSAPQTGDLGVTGSLGNSSASIGAWYNVSDKLVIRPSLGFTTYSNPDQYGYSLSTFAISTSLAGIFELPLSGSLLLGLGPFIGYSYGKETDEYVAYDDKFYSGTFSIGAMASVQYFFTENVGLFLDLGLRADFTTVTADDGQTDTSSEYKTSSFGTSSASIGAVFLFK
jgi:hypothetical protein